MTVNITVDGVAVQAEPGELLIAACERSDVYIPRFCYHKRMAPVGMCRMCLVEVDTGRGPALQPSCMVPVADNMVVHTDSPKVKKAQDGVLEFLLINHPLDCPVCDKGGECPLQDQTMAYGPGESRFVEQKRHFAKPIPISDTVYLDRERCILCDRCTRFADEVAGDKLIHFMGRGGHTEVNTFPDEPFSSYFSGNTVQICPVGALTAAPYRFKARPWDLTETTSTAWVDSVGARVTVQATRNKVVRLLGVDADAVNWGWLSDKERFAFEALNSDLRLRGPLKRIASGADAADRASVTDGDGAGAPAGFAPDTWGEALGPLAKLLGDTPARRVALLGGARLSNEAQYAWAKLLKGVVGTDNTDAQLGDGLDPSLMLGLPRATINDACKPGGTVIVLGPDPKEDLGSLYLRLRHGVLNDGVTLVEITPCAGGLSGLASHSLRPVPGHTADLVHELCRLVGHARGAGDTTDNEPRNIAGVGAETLRAAAAAVAAADGDVTVVLGRASLAEGAGQTEQAARALAGLGSVRFLLALRRGNIFGAIDAGLAPGLLPGRRGLADAGAAASASALVDLWKRVPDQTGLDARGILEAAAGGEIDLLVLLGADPLNDFPDRDLAERALQGAGHVVAVDIVVNDSAAMAAHTILAAAAPTEHEGTFTNLEGRLSVLRQKVTPPGTALADWAIASELIEMVGDSGGGFDSPEAIRAEMAATCDLYAPLGADAWRSNEVEGVLLPPPALTTTAHADASADPSTNHQVSDDPDGYPLRLIAARTMYDDGVMLRHCASSRHLARPATARLNPQDAQQLGLSAGAPVEVASTRGSIEAHLAIDAGVPVGAVAVGWLAPGAAANKLIGAGYDHTSVKVTAR